MKPKICLILCLTSILLQAESKVNFKGQIIGAPGINYYNKFNTFATLQYLPFFEYQKTDEKFNYSFDIAGNFMTNFESNPESNLYRLKLSMANHQSEIRIGLQKLNFGPARVLRSLQWFDSMSATDPLKLTNGVYGALLRHYFLNNNNLWFWTLYGNEELKGIEFLPTKPKTLELGGRSQLMLLGGETGITFHHRKLANSFENKYALDTRWDYFVGSWFESVLQNSNDFQLMMLTIGIDYTFAIGNGLYIMNENMISSLSNKISNQNNSAKYSAIMIGYPISLFDNINSLTYFSWDKSEISQYFSWQRTFDNYIFNINLFYYPKSKVKSIFQNYSGYGLELKLIYNY